MTPATAPLERIGPFRYTRFAPMLPPVDGAGTEHARHRVAIVGGGPVGLALALGLARHGVASVVVEADDSVCEGSRATCISRRSLQIIERLGALPDFMAKGLPWSDGRSFYRGTEVFHFRMPHDASQALPPMVNLQQYYVEQYFLDAIARVNAAQPGLVELRWASQVQALSQDADGAVLDVENALGRYRLRADWVVACDGGQSFVRKALGLELHGTGYEGRYVIVDILLPSSYPTERRAWFDPDWYRGGTVLMHKQPDDLWRIDYQLRPGESTEAALQPAAVAAFVQRHLDAIGEGHLAWTPAWSSVYRAGAMTLERYRHGRVLFAGNAAHAMPIFGVRGLNSGFDDADNLAWKLAWAVRGDAPTALLDSYSDERVQAFHVNAENAMRSTEFMSPPSRGFDLLREAALSLAERHRGIAQLVNPRQTQAIVYRGSPLSTPDAEPFAHGPVPGEVLHDHPCTGAADRLTHALGRGFVLLHFGAGAPAAAVAQWARTAQAQLLRVLPGAAPQTPDGAGPDAGSAVHDTDGTLAARYGAQEGSAYLLRPDGHVAARWHSPDPGRIDAAWRRARGEEATA